MKETKREKVLIFILCFTTNFLTSAFFGWYVNSEWRIADYAVFAFIVTVLVACINKIPDIVNDKRRKK